MDRQYRREVAVDQEVQQGHLLMENWFDPWILQSTCQSVLGQVSEVFM